MNLNDFFAVIFEFLGYSGTFSDDLFQEGLYTSLGLVGLIVSLFLVVSFYFIINKVSFSRLKHWIIVLFVNFLIAFAVGLLIPQNTFSGLGIEYEIIQYIIFGLKNAIIASVFFVIWTYCLKWWYGNAKGTPKLFFGKF